jgi:hypothetical protein
VTGSRCPDPLAPLRASLYPDAADVPGAHDHDKILVERAVMADPALPGTILAVAVGVCVGRV